ncbi:hypothetical protein NP590_05355 [Methylomonas sp. SURF-2]|uniref:Uncharacterized protein n=1 Tax=Methylomonas subterranea TaxID=2952225 RepID=A0ABT1TDJ4_9GAMM|nr:hypothetical protein [Methylomonas sp. SURF-2]MCQ8103526.1 hypothetical protein [Methylomonas sp. SURF-2]
MKIRVLIYLAIGLLSGCAAEIARQAAWPETLPPQAGFVGHYEQDRNNAELQNLEQYLNWIECFYLGRELYSSGWNQISGDLAANITDPGIRLETEAKLRRLGIAIAGEWAKDNSVRRITTRHVAIWGNALRKSAERGEIPDIVEGPDSSWIA